MNKYIKSGILSLCMSLVLFPTNVRATQVNTPQTRMAEESEVMSVTIGENTTTYMNQEEGWNAAIAYSGSDQVTVKLLDNWKALDDGAENPFGSGIGFELQGLAFDTVTGAICIPKGNNIVLDLNGKDIDRGLQKEVEHGGVIFVMGTLTLMDTNEGKNPAGDGMVGKITGGYNSFSSCSGGGIVVDGTTHVLGGHITGNKAINWGGGVYVRSNGSFSMSGGKITDNIADYNQDKDGGAGGVFSYKDITITGGEISGNTAPQKGGGVYIYQSQAKLTLGGTVKIKNNGFEGVESNVYLNQGQLLVVSSDAPLSQGAQIGVSSENKKSNVDLMDPTSDDYSSFFHADNSAYMVENLEKNGDQYLQLREKRTVELIGSDPGILGFQFKRNGAANYSDYTTALTLGVGDRLEIKAILAEGYEFMEWADGVTSNPCVIASISDDIFYIPTTSYKMLERIEVKGRPTQLHYELGEAISLKGASIVATFTDGTTAVIEEDQYTQYPLYAEAETNQVVVSYTEKSITKTTHVTGFSVSENLISIVEPEKIILNNGAKNTQIEQALPELVVIETSKTTTPTVALEVKWDLDDLEGYNQESFTQQTFTVHGKAVQPDSMTNQNGVSLALSVDVTVRPGVVVEVPSMEGDHPTDTPERIIGIAPNMKIHKGKQITIYVDAFVRGNKTYVPTHWKTNPEGGFSEPSGKTYQAMFDTSEMTLGDHTFTITYREVESLTGVATGNLAVTQIPYDLSQPSGGDGNGESDQNDESDEDDENDQKDESDKSDEGQSDQDETGEKKPSVSPATGDATSNRMLYVFLACLALVGMAWVMLGGKRREE